MARSSLSDVLDVPITVAPARTASCTAAVPTPLPTACTRSVSPVTRPSCRNAASNAVMKTSGIAPALTGDIPSGIATSVSCGEMAYSA